MIGDVVREGDNLFVGFEDHGIVAVQSSGTLVNASGYVGRYPGAVGKVTVDGAGSLWANCDNLYVGYEGHGSLTIQNEATVTSDYGYLGRKQTSNGTVVVDGNGTTWTNDGFLYVGILGKGTLTIQNGGAVTSTEGRIGARSSAIVDGLGASWTVRETLQLGYGQDSGLTVANSGHVSVGGDMIVDTPNSLHVTLAGVDDPLLDVVGSTTLDGTLDVGLADDFTLGGGDLFTLIDVGSALTGTFIEYAEEDSVGTFDGVDLRITYAGGDGNDVLLYAPPLGDLDVDWDVDFDDVSAFVLGLQDPLDYEATYGVRPAAMGDMDGDGDLDFDDIPGFVALLGGATARTVPEPSNGYLAAIAALGLVACARHSSLRPKTTGVLKKAMRA